MDKSKNIPTLHEVTMLNQIERQRKYAIQTIKKVLDATKQLQELLQPLLDQNDKMKGIKDGTSL
jgi:transcription termination factor NusB